MDHPLVELILWLLLAFFVGCIAGYFLHWLFGREAASAGGTTAAATGAAAGVATLGAGAAGSTETVAEDKPKPMPSISVQPAQITKPAAASKPEAKPAVKATVASVAKKPEKSKPVKPRKPRATGKPKRPHGLAKARGGKADNLQQISGVGPKLEKTLHGLGFFHFSQIADWNADEVMWVEEHLRFKGRITRDEWIAQAKLLAAGDLKKFERLYGSGGLSDAKGQTKSGTRTRRSK